MTRSSGVNKWILEAPDMPILSCLEAIRFKMMKRVVDNFLKVASRESESLCPEAYATIKPYCNPCYTVENYRLAYGNSINPLNDASQWPDSFGPELRAPTIEKPKSGPRQKKRRLEAGELATKRDKKGKAYKTLRRTGERQKCSVCNKIGHNKRAHGSAGVVLDSNGASSSNPVANNSMHRTPPGRGPVETPSEGHQE
ncbi:hypothetical protein LINPERHAP2_LOCUS27677 [Linum perenne]